MSNTYPQSRKVLDLPQQHLPEGYHYIPRPTQDDEERARRHGMPHGTILTEDQHEGLWIATRALELIEDSALRSSFMGSIATNLVNAASYSLRVTDRMLGANRDTQRSVLPLPILASDEFEWRQDLDGLEENALFRLKDILELTPKIIIAKKNQLASFERLNRKAGRLMGQTGIELAIAAERVLPGGNEVEVQAQARRRGLILLDEARTRHQQTETHPSLAALADHDSGDRVAIRRSAHKEVRNAVEQAAAEFPLAA